MPGKRVLIIGICGVTCGGKTTLAKQLKQISPHRAQIISQDDYFLPVEDPRHIWIPELDHINFDILSSLDMEKMYRDVCRSIGNDKSNIFTKQSSMILNKQFRDIDDLNNFINRRMNEINLHVIIIEGFCIFNYKPLLPLFDLKYYFTLDKDECYRRRQTRVYEPPDCEGYFEKCAWPEHRQQYEEVKATVKDVTYFDQTTENPLKQVLLDIVEFLQ